MVFVKVQIKDNVQDREFNFILATDQAVDQSFFWAGAEGEHSV